MNSEARRARYAEALRGSMGLAGVFAVVGPQVEAVIAVADAETEQLRAEYESAQSAAWTASDRAEALYWQTARLRDALSDCGLPESIINRLQAGSEGAP